MSDSSLNPVRVRGKRYSKKQREAIEQQPDLELKPKLKRKRFPQDPLGHYAKGRSFVYNEPESLSLLSLPPELLETIFIYSLEFNFARASPRLAAAVSREYIYKVLIILAFWADPNSGYGPSIDRMDRDFLSRTFAPFEYSILSVLDQETLQRDVFNCRWCTFARVKQYMPEIYSLSFQRLFTPPHRFRQNISGLASSKKAEILEQLSSVPLEQWDFEWPATSLSVNPLYYEILYVPKGPSRFTPIRVRLIPDKLLRGDPWTEEKISFLEYLTLSKEWAIYGVFANGEVPSNQFCSRETLQDGIHAAVVEHNPRALRTLLELDELTTRSLNDDDEYELPPEHFVTAVRTAYNDDATMLKLLVRGSAESIPYDDPEITAWATRASVERGDKFGKWLLELMTVLPQLLREAPKGSLFRFGDKNVGQNFDMDFHGMFGSEARSWNYEICSGPLSLYPPP